MKVDPAKEFGKVNLSLYEGSKNTNVYFVDGLNTRKEKT